MREAHLPKNAATAILLRPDREGRIEVLLTRRPTGMKFHGGFYVFPGGSVKEEDCSDGLLRMCRGIGRAEAPGNLEDDLSPELSLGHRVAAIRELFEEVGILFCSTEAGHLVDMTDQEFRERLARKRKALLEGSMSFQAFLESESLVSNLDRLAYFSHWLTPEECSIRYDTRFYLALLPSGQAPLASSQEVTHSLWISPDNALHLCQRGELPMIFPTFTSMRTLADFDSLESLRAEYGVKL
jgi:8-oxo-dGTP pyrophosphatase MutT (NUDIX family)